MSGNCEILKCNALYDCAMVEHIYDIHYRARLTHMASPTSGPCRYENLAICW